MSTRRSLRSLIFVFCAGICLLLAASDGRAALFLLPANPILEPAPNDHQVPRTASVSITYDEAIDPDSVDVTTFAVFGMESGIFVHTFSVDGGTIRLTPDRPFHAGELVQVSATTGTLSAADQLGPARPSVWQFHARADGGSAYFKDSGQELGDMNSEAVSLGDLDGDGDLDVFVSGCWPSYIWLNNGQAGFTQSSQVLGVGFCIVDAALGDLDSDGDLDILAVRSGEDNLGKIWINVGNASFTDSGQNVGSDLGSAVALGDLDGDADLDAVYVRAGSPMVLFNDGNGQFSSSAQSFEDQLSMDVALGDLNGDNFLDIYVANASKGDRVYLNNGDGTFTDKVQDLSLSSNNSVALGDLDGDSDLDVLLANEVWFNDSNGLFSYSGQTVGTYSTNQSCLADLDADGDLDVFTANLMAISQVWANDGTGVFTLTRQFLSEYVQPFLELGDLDQDGDVDAFLANFSEPATVWINQNHVYWAFEPVIFK